MIAFLDVDYRDTGAVAAAVLARDWTDALPAVEVSSHCPAVPDYVPGEFYRRELPCLMQVLNRCPPVRLVVVDGFVWLGPDHPGLGARLFDELGGAVPVIGVGKTEFRSASGVAERVFRNGSKRPLWVTAVGIDPTAAAVAIQGMHGLHRVPTLIRRADQLCRSG